jgi:hypothetical protein
MYLIDRVSGGLLSSPKQTGTPDQILTGDFVGLRLLDRVEQPVDEIKAVKHTVSHHYIPVQG